MPEEGGNQAKLLQADGVILSSPVYFGHVTAQLKAFIDRSLSLGHKPRATWKPGLAVAVSAGRGEVGTAHYLERMLHVFGCFSVGSLTALATKPGGFLGKDLVSARATDLARDLARAIREKRRYPATDEDLSSYLFMRDLVMREREFAVGDFQHWEEKGLLNGFEARVQQVYETAPYDREVRREWIKELIRADAETPVTPSRSSAPDNGSRPLPTSCSELLRTMPAAFHPEAVKGVSGIIQFKMSGEEPFDAYLELGGGACNFHEGNHAAPSLTITAPSQVWLAIARKELNGQAAFMQGKYQVSGDMALLMKMKQLFG
ncbi:MAG: SCP2 sterol-binding domain-containing protein [Deltaproteobacteria bacterium]|nr:SCP2 sterol-binding domain-containing protein [Deltaproteobacteria bacterium]